MVQRFRIRIRARIRTLQTELSFKLLKLNTVLSNITVTLRIQVGSGSELVLVNR
jgi:hypothetical protein